MRRHLRRLRALQLVSHRANAQRVTPRLQLGAGKTVSSLGIAHHGDRDRGALRCLRSGIRALRGDQARGGRVRWGRHRLHVETRRLEFRSGAGFALVEHIGHRNRLLPLRDPKDNGRTLWNDVAPSRFLAHDLPGGLLREDLAPTRVQIRLVQLVDGVGVVQSDNIGNSRLRHSGGDDDRHLVALLDARAGVGLLVDHETRFDVSACRFFHLRLQPGVLDLLHRKLLANADHVGDGHGLRGGELVLDLGEDVPAGKARCGKQEGDE